MKKQLFSLVLLAGLTFGSAQAWDEPAQDANGVWQLGSVNDVEWFSDYVEAGKKMPGREIVLQTQDADYHLFKTDILAGLVTYSTDKNIAANLETISAAHAREIIEMNRRGEKPLTLQEDSRKPVETKQSVDLAGGDISRFDKSKKKKKKSNKQRRQEPGAKTQEHSNNHAE